MISGPFLTFHEFKDNFENLLVPLSGEWSDSKKYTGCVCDLSGMIQQTSKRVGLYGNIQDDNACKYMV